MDTLGALALATEAPRPSLLSRQPYATTASLIQPRMWRHILFIAAYQLAMTLCLLQLAMRAFHITPEFLEASGKWIASERPVPDHRDVEIYRNTLIFNAFVFAQVRSLPSLSLLPPHGRAMVAPAVNPNAHQPLRNARVQLFNELNCRSLTNDWNVLRGLHRTPLFAGVVVVSAGVQALLVEFGGVFMKTSGLTGAHWAYSLLMGAVVLPLGVVMRCVRGQTARGPMRGTPRAASPPRDAAALALFFRLLPAGGCPCRPSLRMTRASTRQSSTGASRPRLPWSSRRGCRRSARATLRCECRF